MIVRPRSVPSRPVGGTVPDGRAPRRHATAQRLLEIAIEEIDAHGEAGLRVEVVVERAGVAITAVYHHFGNREGLVEAAQAERYARTAWLQVMALSERLHTVDGAEALEDALLGVLDLAIDPGFVENRIRRASAVGATLGRPGLARSVAEEQDRVNRHLAGILRPFQESGLLRGDLDLEAFSAWITGLILSRVIIELDPAGTIGPAWDDLTRSATRFLLFGSGVPATATGGAPSEGSG